MADVAKIVRADGGETSIAKKQVGGFSDIHRIDVSVYFWRKGGGCRAAYGLDCYM